MRWRNGEIRKGKGKGIVGRVGRHKRKKESAGAKEKEEGVGEKPKCNKIQAS